MNKTENVRIALLDAYDNVICFFDNLSPNGIHYYDDTLTEYLQGSAYTWTATIPKNEISEKATVGSHVAFVYNEHQYYMTIMSVDYADSSSLTIECQSGALELLNEYAPAIDSSETDNNFAYYFNKSKGGIGAMRLNINQIPDKKLKLEYSGYENCLSRLYAIAEDFEAEIEILPVLNDNYGLKELICNVYSDGAGGNSGIGIKRLNETVHITNSTDPIQKTIDISDMYTAILPTGKDGLTISSLNGKTVYDEDGITLLYTVKDGIIYAPTYAKQYPSSTTTRDIYTLMRNEYSDCETVSSLYSSAISDLKKHCHPTITYTVNEYIEGNVGDTLMIEASGELFKARISERTVSFTDPTQNQTTFDDESMVSVSSKISNRAVEELSKIKAEASRTVVCSAAASNGIVFKNGEGGTTLTAQVYENGINLLQNGISSEDSYHVNWYDSSNDSLLKADSITITIKATDLVDNKLGLYFKVGRYLTGSTEISFLKGTYHVSLTNLDEPILLHIYSSNGNMFKNSNISTTMVVNVTISGEIIDNSARLYEVLGDNAKITWKSRMMGEETETVIPSDDPRLSDNGFIFEISPGDVDVKCTYYCELDY